ncbi:MAG: tetraacyldisaccharide 4'-kinase [Acidobacteriota bacterium]|nr:tetraacyldisaccharide 4'-kinase [Acidobacteriota bacterium]
MKRPWFAPLVPLYAAGVALNNLSIERGWKPVRRLSWPVISIGNLSTGGAGKTPLAIALAQLLNGAGFHVDVLSRGYGRQGQGVVRVDPAGTADAFGDEPLVIAREAGVPVYVAEQRYEAGVLAEAQQSAGDDSRPKAHLLDDGFQHRQLHRDVDILLLNRADWLDELLPAGNLREALQAAKRAHVIGIPADEPVLEEALRAWGWQGPIWRLRRQMDVPAVDGPVAAFCGLAHPEQFFQGLASAGLSVAARIAFPDHHRYTRDDLQRVLDAARSVRATAFLTTEKDHVRVDALSSAFPASVPLITAKLRVEIEDEAAAIQWLIERLAQAVLHG